MTGAKSSPCIQFSYCYVILSCISGCTEIKSLGGNSTLNRMESTCSQLPRGHRRTSNGVVHTTIYGYLFFTCHIDKDKGADPYSCSERLLCWFSEDPSGSGPVAADHPRAEMLSGANHFDKREKRPSGGCPAVCPWRLGRLLYCVVRR